MSTSAELIASTAEGDVGKTRDQVDCSGTHDWCAQYVSRVLNRCDEPTYNTFCTPLYNALLETGRWTDKTSTGEMKRGDILFFDRNHIQEERPLDHVVIVTSVDGNTVHYVAGNEQGSQKVGAYTKDKSDEIIECWVRYNENSTFFTDKCIYDISAAQWDDTTFVETLASHAETGGFIIKYGQVNNISSPYEAERLADNINAAKAHNLAIGFYYYWNVNPDNATDEQIKSVFTTGLGYLTSHGVATSDAKLGMWLDFEEAYSSDKSKNAHVLDLFIEVCTTAGYIVAGLYTYKSYLTSHFNVADVKDKPFWYSRPGASRSTVDTELGDFGFTKAYLWQDGYPDAGYSPDKTYYFRNVDNDTQLIPIPTSSGGGGGGGTVSSVTVSVVSPKRIYFSPNPTAFLGEGETFLDLEQNITITTDAENAEIYYTIDGSAPYQYQRVVGNEDWMYTLSEHAVKYTEPVTIKTDTHFRVIAVPSGTESAISELLARSSGTYLFNFTPTYYSWEEEQYAYRLKDDENTKFFEENRQAFLRYHAEETVEEIIYNAVVAVSEQSAGTVQPEGGDVEEGGHADDEI